MLTGKVSELFSDLPKAEIKRKTGREIGNSWISLKYAVVHTSAFLLFLSLGKQTYVTVILRTLATENLLDPREQLLACKNRDAFTHLT